MYMALARGKLIKSLLESILPHTYSTWNFLNVVCIQSWQHYPDTSKHPDAPYIFPFDAG